MIETLRLSNESLLPAFFGAPVRQRIELKSEKGAEERSGMERRARSCYDRYEVYFATFCNFTLVFPAALGRLIKRAEHLQ